MQRYVLRADDGSVTLLHPDTPAEYEQARGEVETSGGPNVEREPGRPGLTSRLAGCLPRRPAGEAKPGGSAGDDSATPAGEDGAATAETAGGGYYVVTTDSQRRAWGLPDLAKEAGARGAAPGDVDAAERHHAVPVVDPAEAMDLLFEDGGNESDGQDGDGRAIGVRRSVRPDAAPVVNLKHGRGPVPDDVRAAFRELCRQPRVDGVLELMDGAIGPLETAAVQELEEARRQLAALRREEVTPERLGDAGGAEGSDEAAERVARTCWVMRRRLGKVGDALDRLDFSGMDIETRPSSFRRLLQRVEDDPGENIPEEGLVAACGKALGELAGAAGLAVSRIRGGVDARRAHQVLDGDTLPRGAVDAVREGLKALDEERRPADPLAATTREVLGRLESADLPLPVLTRALDDIRMSQIVGREAAAVLLERLQLVLELPGRHHFRHLLRFVNKDLVDEGLGQRRGRRPAPATPPHPAVLPRPIRAADRAYRPRHLPPAAPARPRSPSSATASTP